MRQPKPKPPTETRSKALGYAASLQAAAGRLGQPLEVIQAAKQGGAPAFRPNGSVQLDELVEWLASHPDVVESGSGQADYKLERALKTRAERMLKEVELDLARRDAIPAAEMKLTFTRQILAAKSKLLAASTRIGALGQAKLGLDRERTQVLMDLVAAEHVEVMNQLAAGEWSGAECPECGKPMEV